MLPVVDKPAIQYVVEEAAAAGPGLAPQLRPGLGFAPPQSSASGRRPAA
ncbi:hypothetical protein [Streptomyces chromofuscus]|uniref:UTP--glucose-1-phosphate uridylyltransferase n=1 Tax=Streptomyces chromofuscus TaxID=42881 RepID=A0A7M2TDQ2_STRCW|nr:hypothetical protein [Streptomyces chromofuscus]QOV45431.1 hypothetical protein IPT68_05650 [Streptomyces chromofuscus]GGS97579.1 hypothetical protein GCM10010254_16840 [Streptomyces chromofuscus]